MASSPPFSAATAGDRLLDLGADPDLDLPEAGLFLVDGIGVDESADGFRQKIVYWKASGNALSDFC